MITATQRAIKIASPVITEDEISAVEEVLRSGELASGRWVKEFEQKFQEYNGTKYAVATSNGTTALHAAVGALGLAPGSKVITTGFTFIASANALLYNQLTPVFVDVDPVTFNIDTNAIREALVQDSSIKAVLVIHLYGHPCQIDAIRDLCDKFGVYLVEDCAQAHGATFNGYMVGTLGDIATYSFYPTKNMTTGEGGMIVTNNEAMYQKAKLLVNHGSPRRYHHELLGYNFRMTNIAAAMGICQLRKLEERNEKRRQNASTLTGGLQSLNWLQTPTEAEGARSVYHQYTVRVPGSVRNSFVNYLTEKGIGSGVHYPTPVYVQPIYKEMGFGNVALPVTDLLCQEVVSLPVHPSLTAGDLEYVIKAINEFEG